MIKVNKENINSSTKGKEQLTAYVEHAPEYDRKEVCSRIFWKEEEEGEKDKRAFIGDIFTEQNAKLQVEVNRYFKQDINTGTIDSVDPAFYIEGYGPGKSLVYYKAKMLLMPQVLQGHYTGTSAGIHLPYLRGNEKVLTETFKWLYKNGYKDIAADIGREYKGHKHYLEGRTTENTIKLKPSSLYENSYNISDAATHSMFQDIMGAGSPVDVGLYAKAKFLGYGLYGTDKITSNKTGFTQKKVQSIMDKWENITGQKKGCP